MRFEKFLYDPSQMILKPPQSPNKKPPGRTSFIQRKDTRTSFIGVPSNSSGNSSDEEQRPTRVTFTGRKTIGEKASIDDDLEDILATQIRKSMIQGRFRHIVIQHQII